MIRSLVIRIPLWLSEAGVLIVSTSRNGLPEYSLRISKVDSTEAPAARVCDEWFIPHIPLALVLVQ